MALQECGGIKVSKDIGYACGIYETSSLAGGSHEVIIIGPYQYNDNDSRVDYPYAKLFVIMAMVRVISTNP